MILFYLIPQTSRSNTIGIERQAALKLVKTEIVAVPSNTICLVMNSDLIRLRNRSLRKKKSTQNSTATFFLLLSFTDSFGKSDQFIHLDIWQLAGLGRVPVAPFYFMIDQ